MTPQDWQQWVGRTGEGGAVRKVGGREGGKENRSSEVGGIGGGKEGEIVRRRV